MEENNFWGKAPASAPQPLRLSEETGVVSSVAGLNAIYPATQIYAWMLASSGYAAVWATENTREALFAAMKRKETYATTGPRMTVRFFGGWNYSPADAVSPDLALVGYRKGIPMGGDLAHAPAGRRPHFLIQAVKDPDGANLDRLQAVKGWLDRFGELHERVYDVALSDGRKEENGKVPPVGSTVELREATYTNSIGDPELSVMWSDPNFDPAQPAFYYVRVLEIPTPRWTAYDAKYFGRESVTDRIPMITQERAYTSSICFSPSPQTGTAKALRRH